MNLYQLHIFKPSITKKAPFGAFFHFELKKEAYFLLRAPKRLLNLSTRPPVSAAFCLPV